MSNETIAMKLGIDAIKANFKEQFND